MILFKNTDTSIHILCFLDLVSIKTIYCIKPFHNIMKERFWHNYTINNFNHIPDNNLSISELINIYWQQLIYSTHKIKINNSTTSELVEFYYNTKCKFLFTRGIPSPKVYCNRQTNNSFYCEKCVLKFRIKDVIDNTTISHLKKLNN